MAETPPAECPSCGLTGLQRVYAPTTGFLRDHDYSSDNNGRGRYHPGIASGPNDPNAFVKSQSDFLEKSKRAGQVYVKD